MVELDQDMLTIVHEPRLLMEADWDNTKPNFWEGPSIRRVNGLYYLVYPTTDLAGLGYATSDRPDGGFTYRGHIHSCSNVGLGGRTPLEATYPLGNSHGGIELVSGQWYVFDHRMTNGTYYSRQGVAEPIYFADDGSINQVEATSCGLNGGSLSGRGTYPAHIACEMHVGESYDYLRPLDSPYIAQDEPDWDPDFAAPDEEPPKPYVTNVRDGAVVGYRYFSLEGVRAMVVTARGTASGTVRVGTTAGEGVPTRVDIDTEDWEFLELECELSGERVPVYLTFSIEGTLSLRSIEFLA